MTFYYQYDNITSVRTNTRFSQSHYHLKLKGAFIMNKKQKRIMLILTLVTLVIVLLALYFLPDTIPLHYGVNGAGSVASKYFLLIFVPVPAILYWAVYRKLK